VSNEVGGYLANVGCGQADRYTGIGPFRNSCAHAHNCFRLAKNDRRIVNKV